MSSLIELGVDFGPGDLLDLDVDPAAGERLELLLELLDLGPLAADDDPRPGREEDHLDGVAGPLDLDLGDARVAVLALDELADLEVFDEKILELLLGGIPAAPPVLHDSDAEARSVELFGPWFSVPRIGRHAWTRCYSVIVVGPSARIGRLESARPMVM